MESEKLILKTSAWSFIGQICVKVFSFIYTILLARFFSSDDVGTFYLALSVSSMIFIFTDLGLDYVVSRYVPYLLGKNEPKKLDLLLKLTYFGGGTLTILFSIATFIFSQNIALFLNSPSIDLPIKVLSIYLIVNEILAINNGILRGTKNIAKVNILSSLQGFAKLILLLPLAYLFGFNSYSISLGFVISFVIIIPLSFFYIYPNLLDFGKRSASVSELSNSAKINFSKEVVIFGLSTAFVVALSALLQYLDVLMLGYFNFPKSQIAIYSIAVGLANLLLIFPTSLSSVFLPLISELYGKENFDEMKRITSTTVKWTALSTFPIMILFAVFGSELLSSLYGSEYGAGNIVLTVFSIGLFIKSIFLIYSSIIVATRKIKSQLLIALSAAVVNILLNFILIPSYGIMGATFATTFSILIYGVVTFIEAKGLFKLEFPNLTAPFLCAIISSCVLLILHNQFYSLIPFFNSLFFSFPFFEKISAFLFMGILFLITSLVYISLLILFKSFSDSELTLLESTLVRLHVPKNLVSFILSIFGKKN